jgi:type VI secretion system protein ImpB
MPKEESVAPKERVNIVYKPATGGAQEEKELPLKMLFVGDFLLREDPRPIEERDPISIDKDTFSKVMQEQNLSLSITVPNRLSGIKDDELPVTLTFKHPNDFGPDAIAEKVPDLKALLQIREALTWLRGPLGNHREFRQRIEKYIKDPDLRSRLLEELGLGAE